MMDEYLSSTYLMAPKDIPRVLAVDQLLVSRSVRFLVGVGLLAAGSAALL